MLPIPPFTSTRREKEKIEALGRMLRTMKRKAKGDIPAAMDFPGNPLGPIGKALPLAGGILRVVRKGAPRIVQLKRIGELFKKFVRSGRGSELAEEFGSKYTGRKDVVELLREARTEAREGIHKIPIAGRMERIARQELALKSQLYREAIEKIEGATKMEKIVEAATKELPDMYDVYREAMIEGYKAVRK